MMRERILQIEDGWLFVRHNQVDRPRPVLLFVHGLGESGICFNEAFESRDLREYDIVVPDLMGYGRSSQAGSKDYSMDSQILRLWRLMDVLGIGSFYIVGHSLGGDIATFMASSDAQQRIKGFINIEGDLTPHDVFISNKAVTAAEAGNFTQWFNTDFKEELVLKSWGSKWPSCRRYYASLQFARPEAFLENAKEICQRNQILPGRRESITGLTYAGLKIPRVFCWGSESLTKGTLEFLESASLQHRKFEPAFHWPMIDQSERFYALVSVFIRSLRPGFAQG